MIGKMKKLAIYIDSQTNIYLSTDTILKVVRQPYTQERLNSEVNILLNTIEDNRKDIWMASAKEIIGTAFDTFILDKEEFHIYIEEKNISLRKKEFEITLDKNDSIGDAIMMMYNYIINSKANNY